MKDPQEQLIIRDYLSRKRWYYIGGALLHFAMIVITSNVNKLTPLIAVLGGSAFILAFELMRGGGTAMARTMLSLPVTKKQLARSWRFVALEFPIALYLAVVVLGTLFGALIGGDKMGLERFLIIVIAQTGMLGTAFFALTGLQPSPGQSTTLAERVNALFFGVVWGGSFPALMFLANALPESLSKCGPGHLLAGAFIIIATICGWFRAETLVDRRSGRPANGNSRSRDTSSEAKSTSWSGFGGLPYFFTRFGLQLAGIFAIMMSVMWLMLEFFLKANSNGRSSDPADMSQTAMFITILGMIAMFQLIPSLRILRTLPLRLSTITHCLVFWPLILSVVMGLAGHAVYGLLSGKPIDWFTYFSTLPGCVLVLVGLPFILRFGMGFKTLLPLILLIGFSQAFNLAGTELLGSKLVGYWLAIAAVATIVLAGIWYATYRTLSTPHPWRANALKNFGMQRQV